MAEVAKLMTDAGLMVLVSFISPFRAEREMARALFEPGEFLEVFVDTPLAVAVEGNEPRANNIWSYHGSSPGAVTLYVVLSSTTTVASWATTGVASGASGDRAYSGGGR